MATTGNECVVCGKPIEYGDAIRVSDSLMAHVDCWRLSIEMLFSGRYDALTGQELQVLIRMRALKEKG
jgi:hypothetical protein